MKTKAKQKLILSLSKLTKKSVITTIKTLLNTVPSLKKSFNSLITQSPELKKTLEPAMHHFPELSGQ
jgi:hypothetical protein